MLSKIDDWFGSLLSFHFHTIPGFFRFLAVFSALLLSAPLHLSSDFLLKLPLHSSYGAVGLFYTPSCKRAMLMLHILIYLFVSLNINKWINKMKWNWKKEWDAVTVDTPFITDLSVVLKCKVIHHRQRGNLWKKQKQEMEKKKSMYHRIYAANWVSSK